MGSPPFPVGDRNGSQAVGAGTPGVEADSSEKSRAIRAADWISMAVTRRILIVDDNERHLDILGTILGSVGHQIEACGSGAEALRLLSIHKYDVLVLDLVMPDVSGVMVAEQMRRSGLNTDTPVVVCTANLNIAERQLQGIEGIVTVVGKPIETAALILAIARAPVHDRSPDQVRM